MKALQVHQPITLLAHDYGVTVAQELLARHFDPKLGGSLSLHSVAFLNGGLFPECHRPLFMQTIVANPYIGPIVCHLSTEAMFKKNFSSIFGPDSKPTDEELKDFWFLIKLNNGHLRFTEILSYMAQRRINRERWVNALIKSDIPLLFINGLCDPISGAHMAKRFEELIPNAQVVKLVNVGHYPQWENATSVYSAFQSWRT